MSTVNSSGTALSAALSGLKAAQAQLDTISTNIANASTAGYTRKILPQEVLSVLGTGVGVKMGSLTRNVDNFLIRDINTQVSTSQSATVQQGFLDQIQSFYGSSDSESAISSQIGSLASSFAQLSSNPNDPLQLSTTVQAAQEVASKLNDFSSLIGNLRNQADGQISTDTGIVNQSLQTIAKLNVQISNLTSQGNSTADLEDQRDQAIRTVSQYVQTSTFTTSDNMIVVMTQQGQTLADSSAHQLVFQSSNVTPGSTPGSGTNLVYIDKVGGLSLNATTTGGEIGGLLTMRDQTLPTYQAQADQLAQTMASRFNAAGLKLFTDANGNVPASTTPPTPVGYVGFAGQIQVNAAIVANPSLLRDGTTGGVSQLGSNDLINKISQYVFGAYSGQQSTGTANISTGTIFASTGLNVSNKVTGNVNLGSYSPDFSADTSATFPSSFNLTVNGTTSTINVLSTDTATSLVAKINTAAGSTVASLNGGGQLVLSAPSAITLADNTIGATGMASLGFSFGTTPATNPSFTVQVGSQAAVTVNITAATTAASLLTTLNAISGVTASLNGSGQLVIAPTYGGSLSVTDGSGTPVEALGLVSSNIAQPAIRSAALGADGSISSGLLSSSTLADYSRSMVSAQAEDDAQMTSSATQETSYLSTLDTRNQNQSGVDIDEELSNLIRVQTAYSAAGRMVSATEKSFDDLLAAFSG